MKHETVDQWRLRVLLDMLEAAAVFAAVVWGVLA
jgi:hypothetical protein